MLANNIIRQFLTQVIGLISGFATSIITARILGPEGRGNFTLLLNTSGFLSLLLGFSFGTSIIHVVSTHKIGVRPVVNTFTGIIGLLLLCCVPLLLYFPFSKFSFLLPANQSDHFYLYVTVLLLLFGSSLLQTLYNAVLSGQRLFKPLQTVTLIMSLVSVALYTALFYVKTRWGLSFQNFLLFYVVIVALPVIGSFVMYLRHGRPAFERSALSSPQLRYMVGFSLLAYLCNVFQFLCYRMDFWFIEHFEGSKQLGFYSLAVTLAQMLWILPQAISTILLSYSGAETREKSIDNTNRLARIAIAIVLAASVFLFFTIDFIIPAFYGKEFTQSAFLFKILLFGIVPFSITTILSSYFGGTGQMRVNFAGSFLGFLVCLVLDLLLIPRYGIRGAAVATIFAYFSSTFLMVFVYARSTRSNPLDLLVLKKTDVAMLKQKLRSMTGKKTEEVAARQE